MQFVMSSSALIKLKIKKADATGAFFSLISSTINKPQTCHFN